jgi:hypothetical protein
MMFFGKIWRYSTKDVVLTKADVFYSVCLFAIWGTASERERSICRLSISTCEKKERQTDIQTDERKGKKWTENKLIKEKTNKETRKVKYKMRKEKEKQTSEETEKTGTQRRVK